MMEDVIYYGIMFLITLFTIYFYSSPMGRE
jgi:hypothetical protein